MTSSVPRAPARFAAARFASPVLASSVSPAFASPAFPRALTLSVLTLSGLTAHAQTVVASATTLPPVVVTATRFAEDADKLPFGVSVISAQQIRDAGVTTVNEAVMKLLGVPGRLDFYGGGDYGLDLRGFGGTSDGNQVVIVDGVRFSEADLGGTRLAGIPIDSVESIEVIRGNAAVLYGEGATAGALVITTKAASGKARTSSGRGYLGMGSHALLDARGGATLVQGGFSLDASVNARTSDGHRDNFKSSVESHGLTAQWRNEWLRAGVRHGQDKLETGLPGSLDADQYAANPRQTNTPTDHATIDNLNNGAFASATFGHWQIGLDGGHRDKSLTSVSSFVYAYDIEARNRNLRVRHSAPFGAFHNTVTAGLDRNDWTRVVAGAFGSTAEQRAKGVYLTDDLTLPSGTRVSAGIRRTHITKSTTSAPTAGIDSRFTAWDLGVVQPVGGDASVFIRGGRSFRFANVDEIGFTGPGATLVPQTSRDLDLGARMAWGAGRGELRYYRNALRNEIGFDPAAPGPFGPGANVNFDPTLRQGLELELQQALHSTVQLRLNAAARQAKFTQGPYDGNNVALTARRTVSAGVDWEFLAGHKLNGLLNHVSSQSPDFGNTCSMPAITTTSLRYAFNTSNVELALGVSNLADKKYYTQAFRCVSGEPSAIYPEAGRGFVASLRVSL